MWWLYQLVQALSLLIAGPFLLARRGSHYLPTLRHRLGAFPPVGRRRALWLHAVSVGEVGVASTLVNALPAEAPVLITTITPTGQARARSLLGERAGVTYLPFDLAYPVGRFFRHFAPSALILVEGDYWPLTLRAAKRAGLPVAVINGRVGDRSFRRMRRLRPLARRLLAPVDRFGVQSEADEQRLLDLGVPARRVRVTGNLKFDTPEPARLPELEGHLRTAASGRPMLFAGSTMPGEEEQVLEAFTRAGGGEEALLLLAPRHPERWTAVQSLVRRTGLACEPRSELPTASRPPVILLDSLGELASLYRLAAAVFIGGTLVPTGGHNPLEAARFGRAIAVGPSMENFRDMARQFDAAKAWKRVGDAEELAAAWRGWLASPELARQQGERAGALAEANRGALERTLEILEPLLSCAASRWGEGPESGLGETG
jgi:3-deoxy-D-manno-octulosonic-acid transferase